MNSEKSVHQEDLLRMFDNIIKPDNQQKPIIDSILLKFHKETEKIMSVGRIQMNKQLDSLRIKLKQYLNEKEQLERFDVEIDRIKRGDPPQSCLKGSPYKQRREIARRRILAVKIYLLLRHRKDKV